MYVVRVPCHFSCLFGRLAAAPPATPSWACGCRHGWGSVTHASVGTLRQVNKEDVVVDFAEHAGWSGMLRELQSASLREGDSVIVSGTVEGLRAAFRDSPLTIDEKREGVRVRTRGEQVLRS